MINKIISVVLLSCILTLSACKQDKGVEHEAIGANQAAPTTNGAPSGVNQPGTAAPNGIPSNTSTPEVPAIVYGKEHASDGATAKEEKPYTENVQYKASTLPIPDPCALLTEQWLRANTNLKITKLQIKTGNAGQVKNDRSCFFRWDDPAKPNSGIAIQIMTNPVIEEAPNWPTLFITGKMSGGEQTPYDDVVHKYKPFNGFGDGGCYNYALGKYHWRIKDDYLFMLAVNLSLNETQQYELATKLAKEITKNFKPSAK